MRREYQVAICPHCEQESVLIPITGWKTSYEQATGLQAFFPDVDLQAADCRRGCFVTRTEKNNLQVVDHIWDES